MECINGKSKSRRGRKIAVSRFEEEEKEKKQKDVVIHILSLLSLLCSMLIEDVTNFKDHIQPNAQWNKSCLECAVALWNENTLLSSYPQLLLKCKNLMIVLYSRYFYFYRKS